MTVKKWLSVLLALLMLLSLAACGKPQQAEAETPQQSEAAEPVSAEPTAAAETERIRLAAPQIGYTAQQIADLRAAEEEPTGLALFYIAVSEYIAEHYPQYDVDYLDWGWAEPLDQKQRASLVAGDPPSLVAGESFIPAYALEGILEPLPQDIVDSVNPNFLVYDEEERPVSVCYGASIFMLWYNKEMFREVGVDASEGFATWEEWKAASDAVTAQGGGEKWGGGLSLWPHVGGSLQFAPFIRQMGIDFGGGTEVNLTDPKFIETLAFAREMNRNLPAGMGTAQDTGPLYNAFEKEGKVASMVQGNWETVTLKNTDMDWGACPLPLPEGGKIGNCLVGAVYLGVPKAAENKEDCFNLIRVTLLKEHGLIMMNEAGRVPPNKEILADRSLYEEDPYMTMAVEEVEKGSFGGLPCFAKNDASIWEIINQQVLAGAMMNETPIEELCTEAQKDIELLLKQ